MNKFLVVSLTALLMAAGGVFYFNSQCKSEEAAVKDCPQTYAYILQANKFAKSQAKAVKALRDCDRDMIVIDAFYEVPESRWSQDDIKTMRSGRDGRKVVSYLSIGEAEDYRSYWQDDWNTPEIESVEEKAEEGADTKAKRPGFFLDENPDWPGNFKVAYWDPAWQDIIFAELDQIVDQGFDGVFLDIIDGFEFFEASGDKHEDDKKNPATGNTYREDMILLVQEIAARARKRNAAFMVIPQNGAQLVKDKGYRNTISGLALESLFVAGDKKQPKEHVAYILSFVKMVQKDGKPILLTSYPASPELERFAGRSATDMHFLFLATNRALTKLGRSGPDIMAEDL